MLNVAREDAFDRVEAQRLIAGIRAGSLPEWHRFVHVSSPLILRVVRRYLASASQDDQRCLYVATLEKLYRGDLYGYEGRARLSTWLFIYTRSRCLDFLRGQRGRRGRPAWLARLPAVDREVYRLYYRHGLSTQEVCQRLSARGDPMTPHALGESLERLEQCMDDGVRRRSAFDLQARSIGFTSGRLLEYMHWRKAQIEIDADAQQPDARLLEEDTQRMLALVRRFVDRLPAIEKKVIALRFYDGRTAREIATELEVETQRQVYTLEERALRHLRRMFGR